MVFGKLFKLGNKNNTLEDLEEIKLKGKEDEEIRKTILDNFSKLFPPQYFELFDKGNEYELPIFKKIRKPDSLVYCKREKRLWIFEYKSRTDEKLLELTAELERLISQQDNYHQELKKLLAEVKKEINNK